MEREDGCQLASFHLAQSQDIADTMEKVLREAQYRYKSVVQVPRQHTANTPTLLHIHNPCPPGLTRSGT